MKNRNDGIHGDDEREKEIKSKQNKNNKEKLKERKNDSLFCVLCFFFSLRMLYSKRTFRCMPRSMAELHGMRSSFAWLVPGFLLSSINITLNRSRKSCG